MLYLLNVNEREVLPCSSNIVKLRDYASVHLSIRCSL